MYHLYELIQEYKIYSSNSDFFYFHYEIIYIINYE